ncbi:MAG: hypothetical protein ACRDCC_08325 [Culicoidibacterales bacterium]
MVKEMTFDEFIERKIANPDFRSNNKFSEISYHCEGILDNEESIQTISIGCSSREHQIDEYFSFDEDYQNKVRVYRVESDLHILELENEVIVFDNKEEYTSSQSENTDHILYHIPTFYHVAVHEAPDYLGAIFQSFFENENEALTAAAELAESYSYLPTIQGQIDACSIPNPNIEIEVKREQTGINPYSYNLYYFDKLIGDGILDLKTETLQKCFDDYIELEQTLKKEGIEIEIITKHKTYFGKNYEITFSKEYNHKGEEYQIQTTVTAPIVGIQGLDIDGLKNELDELFQDEITDSQSLYSFCGVNENEVEKTSKERE